MAESGSVRPIAIRSGSGGIGNTTDSLTAIRDKRATAQSLSARVSVQSASRCKNSNIEDILASISRTVYDMKSRKLLGICAILHLEHERFPAPRRAEILWLGQT